MTARSQTRQRNAEKRRQRIKLLKKANATNLAEFYAIKLGEDQDRKKARGQLRVRR